MKTADAERNGRLALPFCSLAVKKFIQAKADSDE